MDIREDLLSKLGGEVVQPQNQQNIVDLTGDENQPAESQTTTQEPSNVVDLTQEMVFIGKDLHLIISLVIIHHLMVVVQEI